MKVQEDIQPHALREPGHERALSTATAEPLAPARRRALPGVSRPLAAYAASRVLVTGVAAVVALTARSRPDPSVGPWPTLPATELNLLRALGRWDTAWYIDVARHGYPDATHLTRRFEHLAFFPLFPMITRGLSACTGLSLVASGIVLSTFLGALATVLVWRLTLTLADRPAADRAAALFCFFPGAFVFSMAYAESLMLVGIAGSLLALVHRKWVAAGLLAAVATASRPNATGVLLACAWAAGVAISQRREWRSLWAPALAPVGVASFFSFLWWRTGEPLAWFLSERHAWGDRVDLGVAAVQRISDVVQDPHLSLDRIALNNLVGALGLVFVVVGVVFLWRWRPSAVVVVYTVPPVVMALASQNVGPRPRLLLGAFPLIIAIAVKTTGRAFVAVLSCSAVLLGALALLTFTTQAATP